MLSPLAPLAPLPAPVPRRLTIPRTKTAAAAADLFSLALPQPSSLVVGPAAAKANLGGRRMDARSLQHA